MKKMVVLLFITANLLYGCSNRNVHEQGYEAGESEILTMEAERGSPEESAVIYVSPANAQTVRLNDGFKLSMGEGDVFAQDELRIQRSDAAIQRTTLETESVLVASGYEVDLQDGDFFRGAVELTLPYDPSRIPDGYAEEDVYVAYYYEGEWIPMYGDVDIRNQTITVHTVHNGLWTVFVSLAENIDDQVNFWFRDTSRPQTIEEARRLVQAREYDAEQLLRDLEFQVEYVDELQQEKLIPYIAPALIEHVDAHMLQVFLEHGVNHSGGALMVISKVSAPFAIINAYKSTYLLLDVSGSWGELLAYRAKWERANARLIEARCILYGMEHPLSRTFPPECAYLFSTYASAYEPILKEEQINLEQSAIPSLEELTLNISASPASEPTPTRPALTTPPQPSYPTLYADQNYQCRAGPMKSYEHVADIYSGTSYRIIGRASNGWYAIAIDFSNTSHKSCWIGGGDVSGDVSSVTYYEVQTPTSEPGRSSGLVNVVDGEAKWNDNWCYTHDDPNRCYAVYSLQPLGTITCDELKAYGWSNPFTVDGNQLWLIDALVFGSSEAAFYDYEAKNDIIF